MMAMLIGLMRLGRTAEVRYTTEGEPVAGLSLAYNYGRKGDDGKRPTTWVDAALWGKRAEALAEYLTKGSAVVATIGDLHIESFKRQDGTPGTKLAGRVIDIELAGGGEQRSDSDARAQRQAPAAPPARAPAPQRPTPTSNTGFDDMDDDIPF